MSASLFHLHDRLIGRPLLIESRKLDAIFAAFGDRLDLDTSRLPQPAEVTKRAARQVEIDRAAGIAVYQVIGSLVHRGDAMDALSGVVSYLRIANDLIGLIDHPQVRAVLLEIDSGGGEAAGVSELADLIIELRRAKPIWALANTRAASAAFWLASAAEKIVVSPVTGSVGSIGVVVAHQDVSQSLAKRGIVTTLVYAGDHKVDGHPFAPLPDAVRADIQASVDNLYDQFVSAVAINRGISETVVRQTAARMYGGEGALEFGLADYVGTLPAALAAMADDMGSITQHAVGALR